ncbi:MAG TPA: NADH-quinone oxidoreductase subunit C [Candidatus Binataceae bacterium]
MEPLKIYERVQERFGARVLETVNKPLDPFMFVDPAAIVEIAQYMKDDPELAMDCLSNESGVDYKDRIEVVYHLFSYRHRHGAVLKVKLPRDNPQVATLENIWKSANWMEREIFDLLGVNFEGHSDMRRLLMPEDWPGYPLRKDFVEPLEYHGISTVRESPIIRLDPKAKK